jgi:hypothetical protein
MAPLGDSMFALLEGGCWEPQEQGTEPQDQDRSQLGRRSQGQVGLGMAPDLACLEGLPLWEQAW